MPYIRRTFLRLNYIDITKNTKLKGYRDYGERSFKE